MAFATVVSPPPPPSDSLPAAAASAAVATEAPTTIPSRSIGLVTENNNRPQVEKRENEKTGHAIPSQSRNVKKAKRKIIVLCTLM